MRRKRSTLARTLGHLEAILYLGGWPIRLARALGLRSSVKVTQHTISINHESASTPPLKLGYASDFHAGPTTDASVLLDACELLRAASVDVLLFGGDFVSLVPTEIDWLAAELASIPAPFGRFAVLGNHDWWSDAAYVAQRLEAAGIQVLTNRNVQLAPPFDGVWICGLDDHWCGRPDPLAALAGADGIRVILMHAPSGLLDLAQAEFNLALCGHTHGGQLALPGGIPVVVPHGRLSRRYSRGRHEIGVGRTLVVSVGVGCVVLPLRLFADPEIVVCTLTTASRGQEE